MCDTSLSLNDYVPSYWWWLLGNDNDNDLIEGEQEQSTIGTTVATTTTTATTQDNNTTVNGFFSTVMKDAQRNVVPGEISMEKYKGKEKRLYSCLKSSNNDDDEIIDERESRDNSNDYSGGRRSTATTSSGSNSCSNSRHTNGYYTRRQKKQRLSKRRKKKRRNNNNNAVRFNNVVSIQFVDTITEYTEKERQASFYQEDEYAAMGKSLLKTAVLIVSGNYVGDDDVHCIRGLEFRIPNTPSCKLQRFTRLTSQRAVIDESAKQKRERLQRRLKRLRQHQKILQHQQHRHLGTKKKRGQSLPLSGRYGSSTMTTTVLTTKPNTSSKESTNVIPIYDEEENNIVETNAERLAQMYIDANKSCRQTSVLLGIYDAMEAARIHHSNTSTEDEEESLTVTMCRRLRNNKGNTNNHSDITTNNNNESILQQLDELSKHLGNYDAKTLQEEDDDEHTLLRDDLTEITTTQKRIGGRRRPKLLKLNRMFRTLKCQREEKDTTELLSKPSKCLFLNNVEGNIISILSAEDSSSVLSGSSFSTVSNPSCLKPPKRPTTTTILKKNKEKKQKEEDTTTNDNGIVEATIEVMRSIIINK